MNTKHKMARTPFDLRISLLYALFGGLWILISDRLLEFLITDISQLSAVQTYKGWIFVAVSAVYIYTLMRSELLRRAAAERKIVQLKRLYATLSQVNQTIVRVKDRQELFQTICDVSSEFGEFNAAWIGLLEASGDIRPVASHGMDLNPWAMPMINTGQGLSRNEVVAEAVHTSRVVTSNDVQSDSRVTNLQNDLRTFPFHSLAVIPFRMRGQTLGILALISAEKGLFIDPEETRLLEEVGIDISFALDIMENEKERRQMETALRASEERFRRLFEMNNSIMLLIDPASGSIRDANATAARFYGYSLSELRTMKIDQINEMTPDEVYEERMRVLSGQKSYFNFRHRLHNGEVRSVEVYSAPIEVEGSTVLFSIIHDINERKIAEEQLRRSEARYRLISENSADVIWVFDPIAREFSYMSPSVEKMRGYTPAEVMAQSMSEALTPESLEFVNQALAIRIAQFLSATEGTVSFVDEIDQPRKDGSIVHTEVTTTYVLNAQGQLEIVGVSRDITERKQAEQKLRALNDQLEQRVIERTSELQHANRAKNEFLANMSHELRTPLNTVLGLSETLLEQRRGPLNEKQVHSLDLIASSGRHLLGLINDILEVSKVEAGKLELHISRLSVQEVCESSLNFVRQLAVKKMISVHFHVSESDTTIDADPQRLKQILINLLTNAVKFTPERGTVRLDVHVNRENEQIQFSVSDTGIGIAQKDLKKLFTPFTQLDSSLARQYAGTGLGLTLVQKLTDLHGGSVEVESAPGRGSRFTVALPLHQRLESPTRDQKAAALDDPGDGTIDTPATSRRGGNILLADDNETNITFLADYLESRGYNVSTAHDGEEVLEKAAQTPPDIILMDIQMPRMDGLEAMRHLRADSRFTSTPIIALTALAMPGDKERSIEAGANEYMSKPVSLKNLTQTIQKLLQPNV